MKRRVTATATVCAAGVPTRRAEDRVLRRWCGHSAARTGRAKWRITAASWLGGLALILPVGGVTARAAAQYKRHHQNQIKNLVAGKANYSIYDDHDFGTIDGKIVHKFTLKKSRLTHSR